MKQFILGILALAMVSAPALASTCNVSEFRLVIIAGVQVAQLPSIVDQPPITTSGTSAQSAAFNVETGMVRFWCDTQSAVTVGINPTATTNNMPITATAPGEYFAVPSGQKAAFILRP
jgi:hypothetical protein